MRLFLKATLALGVAALAVPAAAQFGGPPAPPNTGVPLYTTMTGGDGSGQLTVVIDPPKGQVCYLMNVTGLDNVTMAHIHGPDDRPVVTFQPPADGSSGGCQPIDAALSAAILANPGAYYANIHTRTFPGGAIRGNLKA
jgi:hypothetical protein